MFYMGVVLRTKECTYDTYLETGWNSTVPYRWNGDGLWPVVVFEIRNAHKMLTSNRSQNIPYEIYTHVTRSAVRPFTPPFYVQCSAQLTHVNTKNKLQMQRRQPVNVMSPKLENRRQLLRKKKDMIRGVTVRQVLGQHLHSFFPQPFDA